MRSAKLSSSPGCSGSPTNRIRQFTTLQPPESLLRNFATEPNGVSLSVNGLTDLSNKFYYDGIEGMNFDGGTRAFDPSLEAVQEVKVLVNSHSAEYSGAQ